ncbi:transposase, partial [Staphylococcus epidermidis]|uniref:transposase n=1 Tax=Staphylococcus epidermidis TaxID=1282 RepID=UPI0011A2357C
LPIHHLIFFQLTERVPFHLQIHNQQNPLKFHILQLLHQTFPPLQTFFTTPYSIIPLNIPQIFTHPHILLHIHNHLLITHIFNSTHNPISIHKPTKYPLQLTLIPQQTYPNLHTHSFLLQKLPLLIQQLKQSIHHLKQLHHPIIQLPQQLHYFQNIHSIPPIPNLTTPIIIPHIPHINPFKSNKQLNPFLPIHIKPYQSPHTHSTHTINNRGNKKA